MRIRNIVIIAVLLCVYLAGYSQDTLPPTAPGSLTVHDITHNSVRLTWNESSDVVGVVGYIIFQNGDSVANTTHPVVEYTVTGLSSLTSYSFTVKAFDLAGNKSDASDAVNVTTLAPPDTEKPLPPSGLTPHDTTTTSVRLTWTASTDNVGVSGYIVFQNGDSIANTTHPVVEYTVTGLSSSTSYSFTVKAFDAAGNRSPASNTVNVTTLAPPDVTPPTAPGLLTANDTTHNSVRLTWVSSNDIVGVTGYIIFNGTDSLTTVNALEQTITGLTPSTDYSFTVKAFDAAGNRSTASNTVNVRTLDAPDVTNPSAPSNLTANNITVTSARLIWNASTDNVGVTGYVVYQGTDSLTTITLLEYNITGLTPSTNYTFSVRAKDAAGNKSSASQIGIVTASDVSAPSIPAGLAAHDLTTTSVRLTWNPSTDNVGVTGYIVYRGSDSITTVTDLQYIAIGLTPSTIYLFTVRARDAAGNMSNSSQSLSVTTMTEADIINPSAPSNLAANNITATSVRLTWNASTDNVGVAGYVVYRGADSLTTVISLEYNATGLTPSTNYTFSVRAKDAAGNKSSASVIGIITASDLSAPTAPSNFLGNDITTSSVRLTWSASTDNVGVIGYIIYRGADSLTTVTALQYTASGLSLGTSYTFSIRAKDAAGNKSSASTISIITSSDIIAPTLPTNLTGNDVNTTSVRLNWSASSDNIGVTGYIVYRGNDSLTTVVGTVYTVTGLTPATNYSFKLKARDAAGNKSDFSNVVNIRTLSPPDIEAPSSPANLISGNITTTSARLLWNASTDNVGVTGYIIYRGSDSLTTVNVLEYIVTGLTPSTHYSFTVKAKDAAGNKSGSSNVVNIRTHMSPDVESPTAPTGLTAHDINSSSVRITWSASVDNIKVTGYQIFVNEELFSTTLSTEFIVTGLEAGTTYSIYAKAYDAAGNKSNASNIIEITTLQGPDIISPTAPGSLTSNNLTSSSVRLTWNASTDNIGVTGYIIYRNSDSIATITGLEYTASGLTPSTGYTFYIKAKDAAGNKSGSSNIINVTTLGPPDVTDPTAPGALTAQDITYSSVRLTWNASTDNVGVAGYRVYKNGEFDANITTLGYVVSNLNSSTTYSFSVRAYDAAGNVSANSNIVEVTTLKSPDVINPTAPAGLSASDLTATSVHLSWDASTDNYGVAGYRIYANNSMVSTTSTTQFALNGLESASTYYLYVLAYDAAGNLSDTSNIIKITTLKIPDITPPSIPDGLTAYVLSKSMITFKWNPSTDNEELFGYQVYVNDELITTIEFTEFSLIDLLENTAYTFYVRAVDVSGNVSGKSTKISASTDGTIGIQDEMAEMFTRFYLNLGNTKLNVKVPVELGHIALAEIYNVAGSKIFATNSLQENQIIDLDQICIDKGVYILVFTGNTLRHTTKFLY